MSIAKIFATLFLLATLAACGSGPQQATQNEIAELARSLRALGPNVDPAEADRAAEIAYRYTHQLAIAYQITDPPLIHNTKVNMGIKPRGLCWHWAEDMQKRFNQENFKTLVVHRAIANADSRILIDHSTAILSQRGDDMFAGMVIDPWRKGGRLFWAPTRADTRYDWRPQAEVLAKRRARLAANGPVPIASR